MANSFYNTSKVLPEAIMLLENELVMGAAVAGDISSEFVTVGNTINIRRDVMYDTQDNNLDITGNEQDIEQATIPVVMDQTSTIPVKIGALERTFDFDRFSQDVLKPAMAKLASKIESHIADRYQDFYYFGGTPGTLPSSSKNLASVGAILTDGGVAQMGRKAFHSPEATVELADSVKLVNPTSIAKRAIEEANFGRFGGFTNYETPYAPLHTVGALGGTPLVNGAAQGVTYANSKQTWSQTLSTDGWSNSVTGVLKAGDVFTIADVYAVKPNDESLNTTVADVRC